MIIESLGILYPGEMGVTVALAAQNSGHHVYWAFAGRSPQTRERADKIALIDSESFTKLCETCSILICVCPPGAAEDVAGKVATKGFQGLYIDARLRRCAVHKSRTYKLNGWQEL